VKCSGENFTIFVVFGLALIWFAVILLIKQGETHQPESTMDILITDTHRTDNHAAVELSNGKQRVYIGKGSSGAISVCNMNASHKAWRGAGRTFWSFEEAEAAYKSGFMKAAISMAQAYL
jgi:hypothetical protein